MVITCFKTADHALPEDGSCVSFLEREYEFLTFVKVKLFAVIIRFVVNNHKSE